MFGHMSFLRSFEVTQMTGKIDSYMLCVYVISQVVTSVIGVFTIFAGVLFSVELVFIMDIFLVDIYFTFCDGCI